MISGGRLWDADLVQVHVLPVCVSGPQGPEDLDRNRVARTPELLGDGLVERRLGASSSSTARLAAP